MQNILPQYEMPPATWFYMSAMMTVCIFFKFQRFWSIRNLDLVALIAFAPGLLMVAYGQEAWGYHWLFVVGGFWLARLLMDPVMVRRPLLEPNMNSSGQMFTGCALLLFLMTNVITNSVVTDEVTEGDLQAVGRLKLEQVMALRAAREEGGRLAPSGPGYPAFLAFANLSGGAIILDDEADSAQAKAEERRALAQAATTRTAAIVAHLAIVIALVLIGYRHFDSIQTGVAGGSLYLLVFYTSQMTGRVDHVVPAALLVWAIEAYRRPIVAGVFVGLAGGFVFYPLFLLPLWCGFYWKRGAIRFCIGMLGSLLLLVALISLTSQALGSYGQQLQEMFGWTSLWPQQVEGFWATSGYLPAYRIPVIAAFVALSLSLALWPPQKNLGTLLSCSAAVMLATQFWHAYQGGLYIGWYLPLLVLTVFRPNLEDRVAMTAVGEGWFPQRDTDEA